MAVFFSDGATQRIILLALCSIVFHRQRKKNACVCDTKLVYQPPEVKPGRDSSLMRRQLGRFTGRTDILCCGFAEGIVRTDESGTARGAGKMMVDRSISIGIRLDSNWTPGLSSPPRQRKIPSTQCGRSWQVELPLEAWAVKHHATIQIICFHGPEPIDLGIMDESRAHCTDKFWSPSQISTVRHWAGTELGFAGAPHLTTRSNGKEVLESAKHQHIKAPAAWASKPRTNESWC